MMTPGSIPAARDARVVPKSFAQRGRGATPRGERATLRREPGMPGARRTRSLMCKINKAHEHSHHRFSRTHPTFPHALVLTASSVISPVTGFLATVIPKKLASRELDASVGASGPHGFTVRKVTLSSLAQLASTASLPYVRDDRETPLCVGRDGGRYAGDLG
jgi:hypothetical protein